MTNDPNQPWQQPGQPDPSQQWHSGASYPSAQQPGFPPYQQGYGATPPGPAAGGGKGLFSALFDFSFRHFATPHIVKIVYILATVLIGLGALFGVISALAMFGQRNGAGFGLFLLVATPLGALIYLALARMTLEMYVAITRSAEELSRMHDEMRGRR